MDQRGMGNGQQQLMNGQLSSLGNGQQHQKIDARQLGQRMGSQQFGNGMGRQRSTQLPGHHLKTGSMRRMGSGVLQVTVS